jgi:myo-inositol catabolism protein IolC
VVLDFWVSNVSTCETDSARILRDASAHGFISAMPAEKSGEAEFQFEFGTQYAVHIEQFKPTFVKVLVRYNPEDDETMNCRQAARLKELCDYCHSHNFYFMFGGRYPRAVGCRRGRSAPI